MGNREWGIGNRLPTLPTLPHLPTLPTPCQLKYLSNLSYLNLVIGIYPGSFDPVTLGHLDIIERSCQLFEKVIVAVAQNPSKTALFSVEKRLEQIRDSTAHLNNIEVASFHGLTVNYAKIRQGKVLIRGLRVLSDFEMELQMAHTNKTLSSDIETVFFGHFQRI